MHSAMDFYTSSELKMLSKSQLLCIAGQFVRVPKSERCSKMSIIEYLLNQRCPELGNALMRAVVLKIEHVKAKKLVFLQARKQKQKFEQNRRRDEGRRRNLNAQHNSVHTERYLDLPTVEETRTCYRNFYDKTSSAALKLSVCAVCAREELEQLRDIKRVLFDEIPNLTRLVPTTPHPAQHLMRGLLLELSGVQTGDRGLFVQICCDCYNDLQKPKNIPPRLSLANDLWIGELPSQLKNLKFAERLLISLVYPRVFVFKLFPKVGTSWEEESLQRGMRGTVSSYELDTAGVATIPRPNLGYQAIPKTVRGQEGNDMSLWYVYHLIDGFQMSNNADKAYDWDSKEAANYYERHLAKTLVPTPFPAFDRHAESITPSDVDKALTDAVVSVSFNLRHFKIGDRHIYTADVLAVHVLDE